MGLQNPQSINLSLVASNGRLRSGNAVMPSALRYPSGYFAPTVMPMQMIRPAPVGSVMGYYSTDYYGYPGRQNEIRICVQGGAYPYVPVIVSAPAGATIGTDPNDRDNYMVLRFTTNEVRTDSIIVNVFDSEDTLLKVNHTFTTAIDPFRFIATTGSDTTGDGSKNLPWASTNYAYANMTGGRILVIENGTYTDNILGLSLSNTTVNSMIAWESRGAIFDYAANVQTAEGVAFYINSQNSTVQGIVFNNPQNACANPRIFSSSAATHYFHMDDCEFNIDGRSGTSNADNISCVFLGDPGSPRSKFSQTRCNFTGFVGLANGWSSIDMYRTQNGVIEANTFSDQRSSSTSAGVIWPKGLGCQNIDIRNNIFESQFDDVIIDIYMSNAGEANNFTGNIDVSFNLIRCNGNAGIWIARADQLGTRLPIYSRRNTIINGFIMVLDRSYGVTVHSDSDVIQSTRASADPWKVLLRNSSDGTNVYRQLSQMATLTSTVINYECHQNSGVVDVDGNLTGTYLTNYRGRRGHVLWKP